MCRTALVGSINGWCATGHIARYGPQALALYLLLVTVADAQGLSYYSDKTAARLLSLNGHLNLSNSTDRRCGVPNALRSRPLSIYVRNLRY